MFRDVTAKGDKLARIRGQPRAAARGGDGSGRTSMSCLVKLGDRTWVNPACVVSITAREGGTLSGQSVGAHVTVTTGSGDLTWPCDDMAAAEFLAEHIGKLCNGDPK